MHITLVSLGFPMWLRVTHYLNLLFVGLLIRSGVEILGCTGMTAAHPDRSG